MDKKPSGKEDSFTRSLNYKDYDEDNNNLDIDDSDRSREDHILNEVEVPMTEMLIEPKKKIVGSQAESEFILSVPEEKVTSPYNRSSMKKMSSIILTDKQIKGDKSTAQSEERVALKYGLDLSKNAIPLLAGMTLGTLIFFVLYLISN